MKRITRAAAVGAVLATAVVAAPASASARPSGGMQPAYSCSINSTYKVIADWLRVHTQPSASSSAVGQLPYGALFHFCASSFRQGGGYNWVYGYGYNGSVKLTGWVDYEYLAPVN
jgi:hypothetical protein